MRKIDTLIHARWVLTMAPSDQVLEHHTIAIDQGTIIDCLPTKHCHAHYSAKNTVNRDNHIVTPGLINNHTHTPMNLMRGSADDAPLMKWLNEHIWPAESRTITAETTKLGSMLAISEMIRTGTTCFNDHYGFPVSTREAVIESGIRASLGISVLEPPCPWSKTATEAITEARIILEEHQHSHPLVTWTLAPHAPYTVSDDSFTAIKNLSNDFEIPIHLHLSETQDEVDMSLEQYKMRPIQRLDKLGLLDNRMIAVHMVHLTDQEIQLCAERGCHVVHNPQSNLKLGSGIAPIHQLNQAGVNISLGTDGAASNNDLNMFTEMQTASLLSKGINQNPTALPAHEVYAMATINAAKSLGIDDKVGSIEKGKQADLIAIECDDYWQQPVYNPTAHLVYSANALSVSDSWVAGKAILKDKKLTQIDTEALLAQVKITTEQIRPFMYQRNN